VADYDSHEWLAAPEAFYMQSPELPTPMGSGLAAFHDRSAAETLAAQLGGRLLTWEEVLTEAAP
jgi:copper chaperone NosL